MSTTIATVAVVVEQCDGCGSARATTVCQTKVGRFVFCDHDYRKQMKQQKFAGILISCHKLGMAERR